MKYPKPKRKENRNLLELVKRQRCVACGAWPSDPHHVTTKKAGGHDTGDNVMPLSRDCHREVHTIGLVAFTYKYPSVKTWLEEKGWEYESNPPKWKNPNA